MNVPTVSRQDEKKDDGLQKVTIFVNAKLHTLMKEYAKRKRVTLGLAYDNAMQLFLSQTSQFMGSKRQSQLKKGI